MIKTCKQDFSNWSHRRAAERSRKERVTEHVRTYVPTHFNSFSHVCRSKWVWLSAPPRRVGGRVVVMPTTTHKEQTHFWFDKGWKMEMKCRKQAHHGLSNLITLLTWPDVISIPCNLDFARPDVTWAVWNEKIDKKAWPCCGLYWVPV